jgi:hypothetical protein
MKHRIFQLLAWAALTVFAVSGDGPVPGPRDATRFFGDPLRGAEPKRTPSWIPDLQPVRKEEVNQGNPLTETGHFRLQDDIIGKHWMDKPYILPMSDGEIDAAAARYAHREWKASTALTYSLLEPEGSRMPEGGFPLVVICSGKAVSSDRGVSADKKKPGPEVYWASDWYREHLPAVVLVLHPAHRPYEYGEEPDGTPTLEPVPLLGEMENVINEFRKRKDVNPRRVVMTGFAGGASATWLLLLRNPFLYAGAAPVEGRPPLLLRDVKRLRSVPLWMVVGNQNPWQGSHHYLATWRLLQDAGHAKARFWEVQDMGNDVVMATTLPMARWLYARERPLLP